MQSGFVRQAEFFNLGIPYNHHAYFAGAVHERNETLVCNESAKGPWLDLINR